jgi:hypothetical protein
MSHDLEVVLSFFLNEGRRHFAAADRTLGRARTIAASKRKNPLLHKPRHGSKYVDLTGIDRVIDSTKFLVLGLIFQRVEQPSVPVLGYR